MANKPRKLTPLETLVMGVLWDSAPAAVRDVQQKLHRVKPMAYNTVLTVMRILREKGFLASTRDGRIDLYRPIVPREQVALRSYRDVLQSFYAGSAGALVSQLLSTEDLSAEELKSLRSEIDRRLEAADDGT